MDLYKVTIAAGQVLKVQSSTPPSGTPMGTTIVRLFDSAGTDLYNTSQGSAQYQFTAAGTYYVGVSGHPNYYYNPTSGGSGTDQYSNSTGDYRIDLTLVSPTADTAGEMLTTAQALSFTSGNVTVSGAKIGDGLYPLRDLDLYKFSASSGQVLTVQTSLPSSGTSTTTYQRVFDSTGAELAASYGYGKMLYQFSANGTY